MSRTRGLNLPLLQRIARRLTAEIFPKRSHEIGVYYVNRKEITKLNEQFLGHEGPTDVITFNYGEEVLRGEIFICLDEALIQAKAFGTTPQMELVRYLVHGLLHLRGYDDKTRAEQKKMKRAEDLWVRWAAQEFPCERVWSKKRAA